MSDHLKLDIQVTALCDAKPGDDLCQCKHYEAEKDDKKPCRWLESAEVPAVCGYYKEYVDDAKDYLERAFKAHIAKPTQPRCANPMRRRVA